MAIWKKILFIVCFTLGLLIIPSTLLLLFIDSAESFNFYVWVYGAILFAIFGYLIISMRSLSKEMRNALEEMKKQNAAIAYKLTHMDLTEHEDIIEAPVEIPQTQEISVEPAKKVNLNPADPLDFE